MGCWEYVGNVKASELIFVGEVEVVVCCTVAPAVYVLSVMNPTNFGVGTIDTKGISFIDVSDSEG